MDSLASRFIDELPSDYVEKNNLNEQDFIQEDDFEVGVARVLTEPDPEPHGVRLHAVAHTETLRRAVLPKKKQNEGEARHASQQHDTRSSRSSERRAAR